MATPTPPQVEASRDRNALTAARAYGYKPDDPATLAAVIARLRALASDEHDRDRFLDHRPDRQRERTDAFYLAERLTRIQTSGRLTPRPTEAEPMDAHQNLPVPAPEIRFGTLQASTPQALVASATETAQTLASVIAKQGLAVKVQGRQYVRVEGWTTLMAMLGIVAREVETREADGIYTATVELVRMSDGAVVSRASAECGDEAPWNQRPRYARRSMAQTRATGKAARLAFSWVMALAGYEATPYEEMEPIAEAYTPRNQPPPQAEPRSDTISEKQMKLLWSRAKDAGLDADTLRERIKEQFGVDSPRDLPWRDLDRVLEQLDDWAAAPF